MADDGQERLEEYLALERFVTDLQRGQPAQFPEGLTPEQARLYRLALLFHAAAPGVSEVRRAFAERLQVQLEEALHPLPQTSQPSSPAQKRSKRRRLSRRQLLAGGTIAASTVVGAGGDWVVEHLRPEQVPASSPLAWVVVTTVATLGNGAVLFTEANLIGYVVRQVSVTDHATDQGTILALSAACPHMGCLVQWATTDRTFRCPCHGAVFTQEGTPETHTSRWHALKPLTRLEVKVGADGTIAVRMPL